ncbi:HAD-IIA family hydrolase [Lolliginicoccus levis]|uniref:HAD-IIA family hydrolase n=1 Tax=Lolliginicoccus levis TaxID=2919542 RepID=UPI00241C55E4|nr:HAD-IIA family hydrolase [Lolliginicoccus levis]
MARVEGVLFDIDGVLVTSWQAIEGAADAVRAVRESGRRCGFLTSTTSLTRELIAAKLTKLGIPAEADDIMTAAYLTAQHVRENHPDAQCWVLNQGDVFIDMDDVTWAAKKPDLIILGGAGPEFSHEALSRVAELMLAGVPVIAMHQGLTWATSSGLKLDVGAYIPGLEAAGNNRITVIGKPSPGAFEKSARMLGIAPKHTLMIGDDLNNDVLAGQRAGMRGVLVRTGKFHQPVLDASRDKPDHVVDSVADLPELLDSL